MPSSSASSAGPRSPIRGIDDGAGSDSGGAITRACGLPGRGSRKRGGRRCGWRPRREHEPDRLPGDLHRPLVRGPGRRHDLPADRQLRPPRRRRPVGPAVAPRPRRRQCHGRGPRRRAPARDAAARRNGIPAIAGVDTRALARHLRANGCLRGIDHRARRDRPATRPSTARAPCRAGRTRTSSARCRRRPIARGRRPEAAGRWSRSSTSGSSRTSSARMRRRGARVRVLPHTADAGRAARADIDGVILSPGPGDPAGSTARSRSREP